MPRRDPYGLQSVSISGGKIHIRGRDKRDRVNPLGSLRSYWTETFFYKAWRRK